MMPLLADVYKGRIANEQARLGEYGGQKLEAQVVEGGVRFAAVNHADLEYDPILYQRDRGELDWDQRSIGGTTLTGDAKSLYTGRASPAPSAAYDRYMTPMHHPGASSDIELNRIDTNADRLPLLMSQQGYFEARPPSHPYQQPGGFAPPPLPPGSIPQHPHMMQGQQGQQYSPAPSGYREAPLHRPYPPHAHSRQASNLSQHNLQAGPYSGPPSRQQSSYSLPQGGDAQNMAGQGTYNYRQ